MIESINTSLQNSNLEFDTPRYFFNFSRIQVAPRRVVEEDDFRSLNTPTRQKLMEKLIDHVREL